MIKLLSFSAFLIIGLWYAPWWSIALIGILYGLSHRGQKPLTFSVAYAIWTFLLVMALIAISDHHSGLRGGQFLSEYLSVPRSLLYALSASIFSVVLGLSCWTGALFQRSKRSP